MANPKRASMREGPLAALFRKTEEEEGRGEDPPGSRPQERGGESVEREHLRARASGPSPAGAGGSERGAEEDAQIPTPRERLRQAFSSDIPENVMEPPREGHVMEEYHPAPRGAAAPSGQPVIRVVGVGGA